MSRVIAIAWIVALGIPSVALGLDSQEPPLLEPGGIRARLSAGPAFLARETELAGDVSFELGIAEGVQLAAPFALGVRIIETEPGAGVYLGLGITDLYVDEAGDIFYKPQVAFMGQALLGPESSIRGGLDLVGVESGLARGQHPFWLRGSVAVIIDLGPWLTFAAGVAYQRQIVDGRAPENPAATRWVGDSRVSIGAVAAQPFAGLPTLSVHVLPFLDIIALVSFDVDMNTRTRNSVWLMGIELKRRGRERPRDGF